MTMNELKDLLMWSTALNFGVILLWVGLFIFAHDFIYRIHSRWFRLSVETFDALHYLGISIYKIGVLILNLVPLFVILILS